MRRNLIVDFFRVSLPQAPGRSFSSIIEAAAAIPIANRNVRRDHDYLRLQEAVRRSDLWLGDMLRIRMEQLPFKAGLNGELSNIDLEKDEGLGEGIAFLYHIPSRIIAIQRNRSAVTASALAFYFETQHPDSAIELDVILEEQAIQKLDKIKVVRSFDIQIAALDNLSLLKKQGRSVDDMISLSEYFQAPHVRVSLSMGREKGSLHRVIEAAKKLARISATEKAPVEKILITGQKDDEERAVIDVLEYRLVERIEIPAGSSRSIPYSVRYEAVKHAWEKRRIELLRMFGSDGE